MSQSYACREQKPEIQKLLEDHLISQGKDRNLVVWPINEKWVELDPKLLTNEFAEQNGHDPIDWSSLPGAEG